MTLRPAAAGGVSRFMHAQFSTLGRRSRSNRVAAGIIFALIGLTAPAAWAQTVAINNVFRAEGNAGATTFTFTVTVTDNAAALDVNWTTADGTGTVADNDYVAGSGTLSFTGTSDPETLTLDVTVNGDTTIEASDTFFVNLTSAAGSDQGLGMILNDDAPAGVLVGLGGEGTVIVTSTVPNSPEADEYFRAGCEIILAGSIVAPVPAVEDNPDTPEDETVEEVEGVPAENTSIFQIWYNEVQLIVPGLPPLDTEEALDELECDAIERVAIWAGPGHDVVDCSALLDIEVFLYGEDGNDVLIGGSGTNYADGGPGNDLILGAGEFIAENDGPGMIGGDGDDILLGSFVRDHINGGPGNDVIAGRKGDDVLAGGGGFDIVDYTRDGGAGNAVGGLGAPGIVTDTWGEEDEVWGFTVLRGSWQPDELTALQIGSGTILLGDWGEDRLHGGPFSDFLYGEGGADTIFSTIGNASGSAGGDYIFGGDGGDDIYGSNQPDDIYGDGDDLDQDNDGDPDFMSWTDHPLNAIWGFNYQFLTVYDLRTLLFDTAGTMTPLGDMFALPCADITTRGDDFIYAGAGNDWVAGGAGDDYIHGGDDPDLIFGDRVVNRPKALLAGGSWGPFNPMDPPDADPEYDDVTTSFYGHDDIKGGDGADRIFGGNGSDRINGGEGTDTIYGDFFFNEIQASFTQIERQAARDAAYLNINSRILGFPDDAIRGAEGVNMADNTDDSYDFIFGGPGDDTLAGDDSPWGMGDVIQGNAGNDTIIGCSPSPDSVVNYDFDHPVNPPATGLPDYDGNNRNNRNIYVGLMSLGAVPYQDIGPCDTVDYHMVPPTENGGIGAIIDLGYDNPGGAFTVGQAIEDGEGGRDDIYGIENVIGTRHADDITGSTRNDSSFPLDGRSYNTNIYDAFMTNRFPAYPTHSTGSYTRYRVGREMVNSRTWDVGYDNILLGEDGDDRIVGRRGSDALCGGGGNDKIWGDGHYIYQLPQPDVINPDDPSTAGYDEIWGDEGDDWLYGEWGNDVLHGGAGSDYMSGGNGVDTLAFTEPDERGSVVVNLRQGPIDLHEWGDVAAKYAGYSWPLDPIATILPAGGWPAVDIPIPDDTEDGALATVTFPGGSVLPGLAYSANNTAANRGLGTARVGGFYDVIVNRYPEGPFLPGAVINPDRFEMIYGSADSDVIYGHDRGPTEIYGGGGNDILVGGADADVIRGEAGSDVLEGRGGDDVLIGSPALATPPGPQIESPSDWVSYKDALEGVVVSLAETRQQTVSASAGRDRLEEIHNVLGSPFSDYITGSWRANVLLGDLGDDLLVGRSDYDLVQHNRTYILSDTIHGGEGYDIADYRLGKPAQVAAAAANWPLTRGACPAPNGADTCGYMESDGEGGTDTLVNVENLRTPDDPLVIVPPAKKTISPGQSVRLDFVVFGGDGQYKATFDPTWTTKQTLTEEGKVLNTKKVAILAAPADQANPTSPFVMDVDLEDFKAVRFVEGTPAANGIWRFTVYARPLATTAFRATVVDSNVATPDTGNVKQDSELVQVVVNQEMEVTIEQPEYIITAGQTVQLRANVTGGIPPYTVTWVADDGLQAQTLDATNTLIPKATPTVTTKYTVTVQDSTPDSLSQVSTATTKVTVLPGASGSIIPSGDSVPPGSNSQTTNPTNDQSNNPGLTEVTGTDEAVDTPAVTPMCGFGVTSWVVLGNLLLLAVMKRRRW